MTDKSERVRVTGPPQQARSRSRSRIGDVHEQTPLGGVYLRSLLREQALLAGRVLLLLTLSLCLLPLLYHLRPGLAGAAVAGLPVTWLLLGVVVYPWLVLLGWHYVRRVERNEQHFVDLVRGREHPEPGEDEHSPGAR